MCRFVMKWSPHFKSFFTFALLQDYSNEIPFLSSHANINWISEATRPKSWFEIRASNTKQNKLYLEFNLMQSAHYIKFSDRTTLRIVFFSLFYIKMYVISKLGRFKTVLKWKLYLFSLTWRLRWWGRGEEGKSIYSQDTGTKY